jgi:general secretion pathway protein D
MDITRSITVMFIALALLLHGCASDQAVKEAQAAYSLGDYEASLNTLQQALVKEPNSAPLRSAYLSLRERSVTKIMTVADDARVQGRQDDARQAYGRIIGLDKENSRARQGLQELGRDQRHKSLLTKIKDDLKKGDSDGVADKLREIISENPDNQGAKQLLTDVAQLAKAKTIVESNISKALRKTLSIDFKDAMLKDVIEVFSRTTAVNFVFDKDVKTDQRVTVFLKETTIKEAMEVVLFTNQLEQRVLDTNTILLYPNTPAKLKDYQALTVRGFFLSNADPDQISTLLKTLLKLKDVFVDKRQNLITVRDTPENVRLAEKMITLHDYPESEVMLEVEILEVNRNRLIDLGIKYPDQLILAPLAATTGGAITLNDLENLNASRTGATITPLTINAKSQSADINLLANPRIRVRNKETAKILIGDKVPNITTTSSATGFVSSSVQYLDVGLKLEVVPTITPDNEIAIKVALEVSNVASQVKTTDGTIVYQIGTRTASTVLRLRDGENQVLAGLINDTDRDSVNKVPGLGDVPLLGRLFSSRAKENNKSEIVLSITPRLVRSIQRPDLSAMEFETGTENNPRGISPAPPAKNPSVSPAPRSQPPALPSVVFPSSGNTSGTLRWESPIQVKADEVFTVKLRMAPGQAISSVPLAIGFDASKFEILDVQEGDFLKQGGAATTFTQRVDKSSGQVVVTENKINTDANGATAEGAIFVLKVKAVGTAGAAVFRLLSLAAVGSNGNSVVTTPLPPLSVNIVR